MNALHLIMSVTKFLSFSVHTLWTAFNLDSMLSHKPLIRYFYQWPWATLDLRHAAFDTSHQWIMLSWLLICFGILGFALILLIPYLTNDHPKDEKNWRCKKHKHSAYTRRFMLTNSRIHLENARILRLADNLISTRESAGIVKNLGSWLFIYCFIRTSQGR